MFNIINLATGLLIGEPEPQSWINGSDAARAAKELTDATGEKHQPRRAASAAPTAWRVREQARFDDGTYKSLPWACEDWYTCSEMAKNHYAHASIAKDGMLAFTEDDAKGEADRQTRMRPGRYLERYFSDVLDSYQIKHWALQYAKEYEKHELKFAHTADEIEHVYLNGPDSCMSKALSYYNGDEHPVRAYAAGDLAVAYMRVDDEITARAVVWPAKKLISCIYGDEDRLGSLLFTAGYTFDGTFAGAKLARLPYERGFIAPYVDFKPHSADDTGEHLIVCRHGAINLQETCGISGEERFSCERCGDNCDEDEATYIDSREERWCETCYGDHAFYCDVAGLVIACDDGVQLADGSYVSERAFEQGGFTCEGTDEKYMDQDDMIVLQDDTVWHCDHFADHGFQCDECGECFANEDKHDLTHKDCSANTCLACAGDAEDTETFDIDVPAIVVRKHVARQGRDNLPGQLEMNFAVDLSRVRIGDLVTVSGECLVSPDVGGTHFIVEIDQSDKIMTLRVRSNTTGDLWWIHNSHISTIHHQQERIAA